MAKISANGATKVCQVVAKAPNGEYRYIFVMCSDGRILRRSVGEGYGSGYSVAERVGKKNATRQKLMDHISLRGYRVVA